jgi:hypothetical protein
VARNKNNCPSQGECEAGGYAVETVHRLLFRALLEIRSQGHEQKNKVVFHLADLFHGAVLEMENAAEGKCSYEEVLKYLEEKARE